MRDVELKLTGEQNLGKININIDGKPVKFKKNEFGNLTCRYSTENDKIQVEIFRYLDVGGFVWFLTQLFFFLITIFGILDIHSREQCYVADFCAEIELQDENVVTLRINVPQQDAKAVEVDTTLQVQETENIYHFDEKAKKQFKILRITKIFLTIAIILAVILVLVFKF